MRKLLLAALIMCLATLTIVYPALAGEPAHPQSAQIASLPGEPGIKAGLQAQEVSDITIAEPKAEAIMVGELHLRLPEGVYWDGTPAVAVIKGDLEIGEVKVDLQDNVLIIPVEGESSEASMIKISGIKVTAYRSLPEGEIKVKIGGPAVNETYYNNEFSAWTVAAAVNGECITPAPGETRKEARFSCNSTLYTVDGVEQSMDAAAFAENGRTYLPLRYIAYALGVDGNNVLWHGATQTVTLLKGEKVVQVKIGSKELKINGTTIMMDTAPQVKDGRVMVPFRWIALAFGAAIEFDPETLTVNMQLNNAQRN